MFKNWDRNRFIDAFAGIYEHSPWVAEQLFDAGGHKDADHPMQLADAMAAVVDAASGAQKLALLRAHPDLAGKLATTGQLTADSSSEQASAGLDQCSEEEFAEFTDLNQRYKAKFGFPYILAVRGRNRLGILENFRSRLPNQPDTEFAEALRQVHQIARLRLAAMQL